MPEKTNKELLAEVKRVRAVKQLDRILKKNGKRYHQQATKAELKQALRNKKISKAKKTVAGVGGAAAAGGLFFVGQRQARKRYARNHPMFYIGPEGTFPPKIQKKIDAIEETLSGKRLTRDGWAELNSDDKEKLGEIDKDIEKLERDLKKLREN